MCHRLLTVLLWNQSQVCWIEFSIVFVAKLSLNIRSDHHMAFPYNFMLGVVTYWSVISQYLSKELEITSKSERRKSGIRNIIEPWLSVLIINSPVLFSWCHFWKYLLVAFRSVTTFSHQTKQLYWNSLTWFCKLEQLQRMIELNSIVNRIVRGYSLRVKVLFVICCMNICIFNLKPQ